MLEQVNSKCSFPFLLPSPKHYFLESKSQVLRVDIRDLQMLRPQPIHVSSALLIFSVVFSNRSQMSFIHSTSLFRTLTMCQVLYQILNITVYLKHSPQLSENFNLKVERFRSIIITQYYDAGRLSIVLPSQVISLQQEYIIPLIR